MPSKYVIHTKPTPHRFEAIAKSGIIAWEEGYQKCPTKEFFSFILKFVFSNI